jgi:hypothetical protein
MRGLPQALATVVLFALGGVPTRAADFPDLSKVDRSLRKEPAYTSDRPLYGLAAFGPKAEKSVWMVLDRSKPGGERYDVLHIDLNADGDLTGSGERLTLAPSGRFEVGDYQDPATGARHTEFGVRVSGQEPTVMLSLHWRGDLKFGGGYPQDPEKGYLRFAPKPADAPVVWVHGDAPFRFQHWCSGRLAIGAADDFKVFLGQPGRGPSTFAGAQQHFLPPGEWVRATLLYRDDEGKEKRVVCELKERC